MNKIPINQTFGCAAAHPIDQTRSETGTPDKQIFYKTAITTMDCAHFKRGAYVSVNYISNKMRRSLGYSDLGQSSEHWFIVNGSVAFPEHFLTDFVL